MCLKWTISASDTCRLPVFLFLSFSGFVVFMDNIVCEEGYGSQGAKAYYKKDRDGKIRMITAKDRRFASLSQFFRSLFLPQGYPESVSGDYLTYQIWDTMQAFCSYLTGTLATQAMLKGIGVGDESATPLAATITWILKDGTSMVGRIVFAWLQGTSLDSDCKRWRLFADIVNDFALCLELSSTFFPSEYFRLIACISGLCKSLVGVAGGATRAALTMHQARRNNMADVSAKDGSQETMVNLLGLVVGLTITPLVSGHTHLIWTLFIIFTMLHLFANYCAVTCVVMDTINQARLHIICQDFLLSPGGHVMSLQQANALEPVIWKQQKMFNIKLATPFAKVIKSISDLQQCVDSRRDDKYLIGIDKRQLNIVLSHHCSSIDMLKSCFHAEVIEFAFHVAKNNLDQPLYRLREVESVMNKMVNISQKGVLSEADYWELIHFSQKLTDRLFAAFLKDLQSEGWVTSYNLLAADEWRADWNIHGVDVNKTY